MSMDYAIYKGVTKLLVASDAYPNIYTVLKNIVDDNIDMGSLKSFLQSINMGKFFDIELTEIKGLHSKKEISTFYNSDSSLIDMLDDKITLEDDVSILDSKTDEYMMQKVSQFYRRYAPYVALYSFTKWGIDKGFVLGMQYYKENRWFGHTDLCEAKEIVKNGDVCIKERLDLFLSMLLWYELHV